MVEIVDILGVSDEPAGPFQRSPRLYSKHGFCRTKRAIKELGNKAIDRRTSLGKALASWRENLVRDLGGEAYLTTQQAGIVDLAIRTKLMLDSIRLWILAQPSLVDVNRQGLIPVVRERTQLADSLARHFYQLGLERKSKPLDLALQEPGDPKDGP